MTQNEVKEKCICTINEWRNDWNKFIREAFGVKLDNEQALVLSAIQSNPRTSVSSGTARGKDFVAACAAMCFMYLSPRWDKTGNMVNNTKVAMTAPTDRQVKNIMRPEIARLFIAAKKRGVDLPGRLVAYDIRTNNEEWFLTGFKANDNSPESWSGFHAVNTMFVVTEATGISETTYNAIEGNLQGNSRLLIVFNPNITTGYAARAMKSERFEKFRLNSLNAENVVKKKIIFPGQVDYEWVKDKVENWCSPIQDIDFDSGEGDFIFENNKYRPNDLFRVKVLGMFPKVSADVLIPYEWIEIANERHKKLQYENYMPKEHERLGVDVAGMGRDESVLIARQGNYITDIINHQSAGKADHMHIAGLIAKRLDANKKSNKAFIDTIGEGAGVFSRLQELGYHGAYSCKYSEGAKGLTDITGEYRFANMRSYLYWSLRDWLNPKNGFSPALPTCDKLIEEVTETHWKFQSNGEIVIEPKKDIQQRIKRSPDYMDALANTFYPHDYNYISDDKLASDFY